MATEQRRKNERVIFQKGFDAHIAHSRDDDQRFQAMVITVSR